MKHKISLTAVILLFTILFVASGCAKKTETTSEQIKIGSILSLTGNDLSNIAQAMREGSDIAVEEINANGGVNGKELVIIYEDDQLMGAKSVSAANKLLAVDNVSASMIFGANTAKSVLPLFEKSHVPLLVLWDATEELENSGEYVYGIGFQTENAGNSMAEYMYAQGIRSVAVIRHTDEWSMLISDSFVKRFKELGGQISFDQAVTVGTTDFKTVLLKCKDADGIYAPLVGQLDILFKQLRENSYEGLIATGDSLTEETIIASPDAAQGVYLTQVYAKDSTPVNELRDRYIKKYGKEPKLLIFTALGYDGVMVLKQAMTDAKSTDSEKIHTALYHIKGFKGVAGEVNINEKGFASKTERIFRIQNGTMVLVE